MYKQVYCCICKYAFSEQGLRANVATLQNRTDDLYKCFKDENMEAFKKSGTEEDISDRDKLLQELVDKKEDSMVWNSTRNISLMRIFT